MRREDKVVYTFGSHQQQHDIRLVFRLPALYSDPPVSLAASSQRSTYPENQYPFRCLDLCFDLYFFPRLWGWPDRCTASARPLIVSRTSKSTIPFVLASLVLGYLYVILITHTHHFRATKNYLDNPAKRTRRTERCLNLFHKPSIPFKSHSNQFTSTFVIQNSHW